MRPTRTPATRPQPAPRLAGRSSTDPGAAPGADPRDAFVGRRRSRVEEALRLVAAELFEDVHARLLLDTFGNGAQAECARQLDRVARHREVPGRAEIEDERLVDLEGADRQAREVRDRRVAGP